MKNCFTILFLFFFTNIPGFSQPADNKFIVQSYNESDGLPNNTVFIIRQDRFGFLWIATWDGLSRFDGHSFKNYHHDPNDSTTLPYFYFQYMCIDKSNNIWMIGNSRIARYDWLSDKFIRYNPANTVNGGKDTYCMNVDQQGRLFVKWKQKMFRFCDTHRKFERVEIRPTADNQILQSCTYLFFDENNGIWFCDFSGHVIHGWITDSAEHNFTINLGHSINMPFGKVKSENFIADGIIRSLDQSQFLLASNLGLFLIDTLKRSGIELTEKDTEIITKSSHNLAWSLEDSGLFFYHADNKEITPLIIGNEERTLSYFVDNEHNIWSGTIHYSGQGTGLYVHSDRKIPWSYLPPGNRKMYKDLAVYAITEDAAGSILLGSKDDSRLTRISKTGKTENITVLPLYLNTGTVFPRAIYEDPHRNLWIGFLRGYLFKSNPGKGFLQIYPEPFIRKQKTPFRAKLLAGGLNPDNIMVIGSTGIIQFNMLTNQKTAEFKNDFGDLMSYYRDSSGFFYVGNCGLLYKMTNELVLKEKIAIADQLYNIEDICPADSARLWLALLGGGLCLYDPKTGKQQIYSTRNGLVNNVVYSILKDRRENLWLSTNLGISMFNTKTRTFVNYGEKDGLDIREFNSEAAFRMRDGSFLFGGMGGVVKFNPDSINVSDNKLKSSLLITDLTYRINGANRFAAVYGLKKLTLEKGIRNLKINFSEINFINQQKSSFRYRISGFLEEWNMIDPGSRTIEITGMHPGEFEVFLSASDVNGNWSKNTSVLLIIPPYYYETLWFKILIEIVVIVIIMIFIMVRIRQIRLIHKNRISNLKQLALQEQLNPHFISNSLTAVESFTTTGDEIKTNEYISRLYSLMRKMIDYGGKEFVPLADEMELLRDYLEAEKMRVGFDFSIDCPPEISENILIAPSFIQPILENAIKHGIRGRHDNEGMIRVSFRPPGVRKITCCIVDNGKGFSMNIDSGKGVSFHSKGLRIIRERLKLYRLLMREKFEITVKNAWPDELYPGAEITIDIPVKKE